MPAIHDLPPELLGLIFEQYYLAIGLELPGFPTEGVYHDKSETGEMVDTDFFPWNIARVSLHWRHVVSLYPHFFTWVVLDLESPEPFLLEAFSWSKNLPFRVTIFNSLRSSESKSSENITSTDHKFVMIEHNRVASITEALVPHLARCLCLEYHVGFTSSLPCLLDLISNIRVDVHCLRLSGAASRVLNHPTIPSHIKTPLIPLSSLANLCLRVADFISVGRLDPQFWGSCKSEDMSLELYDYDFCGTSSSKSSNISSTHEFFSYLSSMEPDCIKLRNLSVCEHHVHFNTPQPRVETNVDEWEWGQIDGGSFTFECLTRRFLQSLFEVSSIIADAGYITNCDLPASTFLAIACRDLTLTNLPVDTELDEILELFDGETVTFQNFKFLSDGAFWVLASNEFLTDLEIRNCDGYSIKALKNLYKAKAKGEWPLEIPRLSGTGPQLSEEDKEWFSSYRSTEHFDD